MTDGDSTSKDEDSSTSLTTVNEIDKTALEPAAYITGDGTTDGGALELHWPEEFEGRTYQSLPEPLVRINDVREEMEVLDPRSEHSPVDSYRAAWFRLLHSLNAAEEFNRKTEGDPT